MMNKDKFCINFLIEETGEIFSAKDKNNEVMKCTFTDGLLDFWIIYDYDENIPLHLKSCAKINDKVTINILPYRIELLVCDNIVDEEWPCGNHFISEKAIIEKNCNLEISDIKTKTSLQPSVIGHFQNASGWKPENNVFVGDCMPYSCDGRYHVLYLKDRHHHKSKWGRGAHQWSHISTENFIDWDIHPMAVEIDNPAEGSICTGSWIRDNDIHYLFYTVRTCDDSPAKICRSFSKDGFHFEKDRNFSFTLSNKYTAETARDPKIIKDVSGMYHMILTTSLSAGRRGCLAHLVSKNLNQWQELAFPIFVAPENSGEPECPDYFYKDGFYYLVYSLGGKGYYQYSEKPFECWHIPQNPIIPCKTVPKAAIWNNRLIFTGFNSNAGYAGTMTFLEAIVQKNGEMKYQNL